MEIVILIVVIPFVWLLFRKVGTPLWASLIVTTILEIVNETVLTGGGTFYPEILIPFPFFKFPVLIVLLGCFYSGVINFAALKVSGFFANKYLSAFAFLLSVALMNLLSILVESIGIYTGYWVHNGAAGVSAVYFPVPVYIYYLFIVVSASVFIVSGFFRKKT
ncbi:hypothetical protein J5834_02240 [bacterium]|nr:hypothetical protein [bacterium]